MVLNDIANRLDVTRARIEADASGPAVITVTSAERGDGKGLVALALAHSFARVGYRVLLVGADERGPLLGDLRSAPRIRPEHDVLSFVREGAPGTPALLDLIGPGVAWSRETTDATFARFRAEFLYTIVHAPVFSESGTAFSLAAAADRVLVAFRKGRRGGNADRTIAKQLEAANASVSGVITVDSAAIRAFEREQQKVPHRAPSLALRLSEDVVKSASVDARVG